MSELDLLQAQLFVWQAGCVPLAQTRGWHLWVLSPLAALFSRPTS